MTDGLTHYLEKFRKLKIDRAHGLAPHKPLLLISVLQAYSKGILTGNIIPITPELVSLFKTNWQLLVTTNHVCQFALPFYHLTSDKFWNLVPNDGFESLLLIKSSMRSFAALDRAVQFAVIDEDLALLMVRNETNEILTQFLLDQYFPLTRVKFVGSSVRYRDIIDNIEGQILQESPTLYRTEIDKLILQKDEEALYMRGALFKREVPKIYKYRCCISGLKIDATINVSMVDACHIVPFAVSHDDTITNGISLCPNLHRAFDRGLISIDESYHVLVSQKFKEHDCDYSIRSFQGKRIFLPQEARYMPGIENLKWHHEHVFKSA